MHTFNMAFRGEDKIVDQIYEQHSCSNWFYKDFNNEKF